MRNDDIGAESDKFLGILLGTIASPVGIAKLDLDVFTIRVAEGAQTAPECIGERMRRRRGHQHSNKGEFSWSLCARPKRPRRSHSAEQRNELPSPHWHSLHARITHLTGKAVLCITAFWLTRLPQRVMSVGLVICAACPIYTQHRTFPDLVGTSQWATSRHHAVVRIAGIEPARAQSAGCCSGLFRALQPAVTRDIGREDGC